MHPKILGGRGECGVSMYAYMVECQKNKNQKIGRGVVYVGVYLYIALWIRVKYQKGCLTTKSRSESS